jgi:hypothetical protein
MNMKKDNFLLFLALMFFYSFIAQTKNMPKSIINTSAVINKFHEKSELDRMQKGPLVELYLERIKVLVNRIPFIALTNKRGVTMGDVGIPDNNENNKVLDRQHQAILDFLTETESCEKALTPFADKESIVNAILSYEEVIKDFRMLNE